MKSAFLVASLPNDVPSQLPGEGGGRRGRGRDNATGLILLIIIIIIILLATINAFRQATWTQWIKSEGVISQMRETGSGERKHCCMGH